jgi:hypothetical protein
MARVRQAMAANAARWGADLPDSLLFVARQREPLKLPPPSPASGAPVALVLALHQEVFAWSPATGRYRAVTAEDGRVLAMAQSADGQGLLYVTAEKLVRGGAGGPALRGVVLHTLALASMAPGPPVAIDGDVRRIAIAPAGTRFALAIDSADFWLAMGGAALVPSRRTELGRDAIVLGATGVAPAPARRRALPGPCHLVAREGDGKGKGGNGRSIIEIEAPGKKPFVLRPQLGAGLAGLAIP